MWIATTLCPLENALHLNEYTANIVHTDIL